MDGIAGAHKKRHADTRVRERNRVGIDVAAGHTSGTQEMRGLGENARARSDIQNRAPGSDVFLQRFQTQLRGRMAARAARHPWFDFQPEPSWRSLFVGPWRNQIEPLADAQRRPGIARGLRPIDCFSLFEPRLVFRKSVPQRGSVHGIVKKRAQRAWFFGNSQNAAVGKLRDDEVLLVGSRVQNKRKQISSSFSRLRLVRFEP